MGFVGPSKPLILDRGRYKENMFSCYQTGKSEILGTTGEDWAETLEH